MHDIAVLNDIILAFDAHFSGRSDRRLRLILDEVVILDHLGPDKAFFEVGMDDARRLRRLVSPMDCPGPALVGSGGEEGLESEEVVGSLDEPDDAGLMEPHLFEEHLPVFVVLHLGNFGFGAGGDHEDLGVLVLDGFADGVHILVAADGGGVVDVADIHDRLVGQQEEIVRERGLFFVEQRHAAAGLALLKGLLIAKQQRQELLRLLVAAGRRLLLDLGDAGVDRLKVLDLELQVHDFLVANRVHGAVHMDDVAVVEAAQHVQDGVALPDIGQELVAKTFPPACTAHQARDVDDVDRGGNRALRVADFRQHLQALVRDIGGAEVGLDGAEREIGALGAPGAHAVEEGGLAYVRQADDTALEGHRIFAFADAKIMIYPRENNWPHPLPPERAPFPL